MRDGVQLDGFVVRVHQYLGLRPGPALIVLGRVHGNERAGSLAIARLIDELDNGRLQLLRGRLTLVPVTNPLAAALDTRSGDRNLNRNLRPTAVPQDFEDRIANVLCPLLAQHQGLIDLHSFNSAGDPFALMGPEDNVGDLEPFSLASQEALIARHLGPRRIVEGWMSAYAEGVRRRRVRSVASGTTLDTDPSYGVGTTEYMRSTGGWAVTLECGQHADPGAPDVGVHAVRQALGVLGMIQNPPEAPRDDHELLRLVEVTDRLHAEDRFVREWTSFDEVAAGEAIGVRHDGSMVVAPADGRIVFPNVKAEPGFEWFYFAQVSPRRLG
jgi:predicted deacylase